MPEDNTMTTEKKPPSPKPDQRNWVAKNAHRFNKAQTFADRTTYKRNRKHKQRPESWPVSA